MSESADNKEARFAEARPKSTHCPGYGGAPDMVQIDRRDFDELLADRAKLRNYKEAAAPASQRLLDRFESTLNSYSDKCSMGSLNSHRRAVASVKELTESWEILRAERERKPEDEVRTARRTGAYWKAEHIEANKVIDDLTKQLAEAKAQVEKANSERDRMFELRLNLPVLVDSGDAKLRELRHVAIQAINTHQDMVGWQDGESRNALVSEISSAVEARLDRLLADPAEALKPSTHQAGAQKCGPNFNASEQPEACDDAPLDAMGGMEFEDGCLNHIRDPATNCYNCRTHQVDRLKDEVKSLREPAEKPTERGDDGALREVASWGDGRGTALHAAVSELCRRELARGGK